MDDLIAFITARLDETGAAALKSPDEFWRALALRTVEAIRAILAQREHSPAGSPVLTYALYEIAAIWNDHPDYRPEWKP